MLSCIPCIAVVFMASSAFVAMLFEEKGWPSWSGSQKAFF
jgi:hypothetical protein